MANRPLKMMAVASTIAFIFLGDTRQVFGMWGGTDENEQNKIGRCHLTHLYGRELVAPDLKNPRIAQEGYSIKTIYKEGQCLLCKDNLDALRTQKNLQERLLALEDTLKDTVRSTAMLEKMNEEIQGLKSELRLMQPQVLSLFFRGQEESIKLPEVAHELKNLEEKTEAPTIFQSSLHAAEDKGRKEEKRDIARKLMDEHLKDEIVLRITGLTIEELRELRNENILIQGVNTLNRIVIPEIAHGYEEVYKRFLKGVLVYRPQERSDVGKIEMPIAALANPLDGTFDLSRCGDTGKYFSISTGYRKGKKAENANKTEIWLTPRFLIEKELRGSAKHLAEIMGAWNGQEVPVGIFFTWGGWNYCTYYDYLVTQAADIFEVNNFYEKWALSHGSKELTRLAQSEVRNGATRHERMINRQPEYASRAKRFHFHF